MTRRSKVPGSPRRILGLALVLGALASCRGEGPHLLVTVAGGDGSAVLSLQVTATTEDMTASGQIQLSSNPGQFSKTLPEGASGEVQVDVSEVGPGGCVVAHGTGSATIDRSGETDVSVVLSCPEGLCPSCMTDAHIELSPSSASIGPTDTDSRTPGAVTLMVKNAGTAPASPLHISPLAAPFSIGSDTTCTMGIQLRGGDSCQIQVNFQPAAYGRQTTDLTLAASPEGGIASASLAATGRDSLKLDVIEAGSGSGSVTAPAGQGTVSGSGITCPGACSQSYYRTTAPPPVTLKEAAGRGSRFSGWSGGSCSGAAESCELALSGPTAVTATFALCNTGDHCGDGCVACPDAGPANSSPACTGSTCSWACDSGYVQCGGTCFNDTSTNPARCGSTCSVCTGGPANSSPKCQGGACGWDCDSGYIKCGNACVNDECCPQTCHAPAHWCGCGQGCTTSLCM